MLSRYQIVRGKRPAGYALPDGVRQDARMHTHHPLRPPRDAVDQLLSRPITDETFAEFRRAYLHAIDARHRDDPEPFRQLADLAEREDVFLGCSCPTRKNPDVRHCHTWLALEWMRAKYPKLEVRFPRP